MMSLSDDQKRLVLDWMRKLHTLEYAHRYASVNKERLNFLFGIPIVVGSSIIGAQASSSWQGSSLVRVIFGAAGGLTAVLAALLTFLKPTEAAEKHRSTSAVYEALRHRLEFLITFHEQAKVEVTAQLAQLKDDWEKIESPNVSTRIWERAKRRVSEVGTYPEFLSLPEFTAGLHGGNSSNSRNVKSL